MMHDTAQEVYFANVAFYIEILLMLLLFVSFYFASEKNFKVHRRINELMVLIQTFLVFYMMNSFLFTSYGKNFIIHVIIGSFTYIMIIYTILLMEGKIPYKQLQVPQRYRKNLMRFVMVLWWWSIFYGAYSLFTIVDWLVLIGIHMR